METIRYHDIKSSESFVALENIWFYLFAGFASLKEMFFMEWPEINGQRMCSLLL
jgi:hypothetical protein